MDFHLVQGANGLHMVQLMPLAPGHLLLHQNPERFDTFLMPACPYSPGKTIFKLDGKYSERVQIPAKAFLSLTLGNTCHTYSLTILRSSSFEFLDGAIL